MTIFHEALERAEAEGRAERDPALTFVSPGPHRLPIRPILLAEQENGDRVYSCNLRQVRKMVALIDEDAKERAEWT